VDEDDFDAEGCIHDPDTICLECRIPGIRTGTDVLLRTTNHGLVPVVIKRINSKYIATVDLPWLLNYQCMAKELVMPVSFRIKKAMEQRRGR
jgi:hypothetical protein